MTKIFSGVSYLRIMLIESGMARHFYGTQIDFISGTNTYKTLPGKCSQYLEGPALHEIKNVTSCRPGNLVHLGDLEENL